MCSISILIQAWRSLDFARHSFIATGTKSGKSGNSGKSGKSGESGTQQKKLPSKGRQLAIIDRINKKKYMELQKKKGELQKKEEELQKSTRVVQKKEEELQKKVQEPACQYSPCAP